MPPKKIPKYALNWGQVKRPDPEDYVDVGIHHGIDKDHFFSLKSSGSDQRVYVVRKSCTRCLQTGSMCSRSQRCAACKDVGVACHYLDDGEYELCPFMEDTVLEGSAHYNQKRSWTDTVLQDPSAEMKPMLVENDASRETGLISQISRNALQDEDSGAISEGSGNPVSKAPYETSSQLRGDGEESQEIQPELAVSDSLRNGIDKNYPTEDKPHMETSLDPDTNHTGIKKNKTGLEQVKKTQIRIKFRLPYSEETVWIKLKPEEQQSPSGEYMYKSLRSPFIWGEKIDDILCAIPSMNSMVNKVSTTAQAPTILIDNDIWAGTWTGMQLRLKSKRHFGTPVYRLQKFVSQQKNGSDSQGFVPVDKPKDISLLYDAYNIGSPIIVVADTSWRGFAYSVPENCRYAVLGFFDIDSFEVQVDNYKLVKFPEEGKSPCAYADVTWNLVLEWTPGGPMDGDIGIDRDGCPSGSPNNPWWLDEPNELYGYTQDLDDQFRLVKERMGTQGSVPLLSPYSMRMCILLPRILYDAIHSPLGRESPSVHIWLCVSCGKLNGTNWIGRSPCTFCKDHRKIKEPITPKFSSVIHPESVRDYLRQCPAWAPMVQVPPGVKVSTYIRKKNGIKRFRYCFIHHQVGRNPIRRPPSRPKLNVNGAVDMMDQSGHHEKDVDSECLVSSTSQLCLSDRNDTTCDASELRDESKVHSDTLVQETESVDRSTKTPLTSSLDQVISVPTNIVSDINPAPDDSSTLQEMNVVMRDQDSVMHHLDPDTQNKQILVHVEKPRIYEEPVDTTQENAQQSSSKSVKGPKADPMDTRPVTSIDMIYLGNRPELEGPADNLFMKIQEEVPMRLEKLPPKFTGGIFTYEVGQTHHSDSSIEEGYSDWPSAPPIIHQARQLIVNNGLLYGGRKGTKLIEEFQNLSIKAWLGESPVKTKLYIDSRLHDVAFMCLGADLDLVFSPIVTKKEKIANPRRKSTVTRGSDGVVSAMQLVAGNGDDELDGAQPVNSHAGAFEENWDKSLGEELVNKEVTSSHSKELRITLSHGCTIFVSGGELNVNIIRSEFAILLHLHH